MENLVRGFFAGIAAGCLAIVVGFWVQKFWAWYNAPLVRPRRYESITPEQARTSILSLMEQRVPVLAEVHKLKEKSFVNPTPKVLQYLADAEFNLANYNNRIHYYEQFLGPVEFLKLQKEKEKAQYV